MAVLLRRFWIQITADRKRFAVLCATVALGLLLWSRIILVSKVPRTAMAEPAEKAMDQPGRPSSSKQASGSSGAQGDRTDPPKPLPVVTVTMQRVPQRDPFTINPFHFPKPTGLTPAAPEPSKSEAQSSEEAHAGEERLLADLRTMVNRLQLEAVMQGTPMAMINGKTYRLHDTISIEGAEGVAFQLTEVNRMSVVLECRGYRFKRTLARSSTKPASR